jgi:uncharacterized protein
MKTHIISLAIGLAAGCLGGLIGVGGGIIMIPLMVGILKLSQHQAHGTSLLALVFTGLGGALAYGLHGEVSLPAAAVLAFSAMMTARAGAHYAHALPGWRLRKAFGGFLIGCAVLFAFKPYLPAVGPHDSLFLNFFLFLTTGLVTGFLSGMMGVGGGAIMIPAMVLLAGFGQHEAQGTALAVMIPVGLTGALTHHRLGNVAKRHLPGLVCGILLGAVAGGNLANLLAEAPLGMTFMVVIAIMGFRYLKSTPPVAGDRADS